MKTELENLNAGGKPQSLELKPLTLLFGPNGGGKSSVIRALPKSALAPPATTPSILTGVAVAHVSGCLQSLTGHSLAEWFGAQVLVCDPQTGARMRPEDAGTGVSQVLPIVADLSASAMGVHRERAGWLTMDHPEAHLHPRAQVELGDLFIRAANGGGKYLIETHSEHLLLRLLRRIDETNSGKLPDDKHQLRPDDVSINYVWRRDGEIIVRHLPVDQSGEFLEMWPEGFFMERLDELIY